MTTRTKPLPAFLILIIASALILAACADPTPTTLSVAPTPDPTAAPAPTATEPPPTEAPQPTAEPEPAVEPATSEQPMLAPEEPAPEEDAQPTATPEPDSGLTAAFPAPATAQGDVIILVGRVLDTGGAPLPGVAVEIWQTDASGIYDHPGDPSTGGRDLGFQFYGTSVSDESGRYQFRTVMPGQYEPRPRHIHVKVRRDGSPVLITQFYFQEDRAALENEGLFAQAGSRGELLLLTPIDAEDVSNGTAQVLTNDLVLDTGTTAGALTPTPPQGEGPYYPLVTLADYDNDLAAVR